MHLTFIVNVKCTFELGGGRFVRRDGPAPAVLAAAVLGAGALGDSGPLLLGARAVGVPTPSPAPPAAPTAALGEVPKQIARQGGGLPRHTRPRSAQHLLGLGGVREGSRQQGCAQPPVLLARCLDQPPRVARVSAAR